MIDEAVHTLHYPTTNEGMPVRPARSWVPRLSAWFALGLIAASWLFVATERGAEFADLFSTAWPAWAKRNRRSATPHAGARPAGSPTTRWR